MAAPLRWRAAKSNVTFTFSAATREIPLESFVHLRKGTTPRRLHADLDGLKAGATHYYAGPDQRDALGRAVGTITDWLARHDFTDPR